MNPDAPLALAGILALGVVHGINPGMGWLFAVAIGLQERSARAVYRSIGPLALGHAAAIAVVIAIAAVAGLVVPRGVLRGVVAVSLLALGVLHLRSHRHVRYGGMRVRGRQLAMWSFLVAMAHGAGVMALPFVLDDVATVPAAEAGPHVSHGSRALESGVPRRAAVALATMAHTAGYLLAMGAIAIVVFRRLGLRLLRRAWINIDLLWAGSLIATAGFTMLL